jgi:urease accessory protein
MFAVTSPSDAPTAPYRGADLPGYVRSEGLLRMRLAPRPRGTEAVNLHESGGFRVRFPRVGPCEAVMINTGGGMTGGDRLSVAIALDAGADAIATTQSAEKVYRSTGAATRVDVTLTLAQGARFAWLPQESILFDGARLSRRFTVDMAADARLTLAESITFGRTAMGEEVRRAALSDTWRIRRAGALAFAENIRLDGDLAAMLDRGAVGGGARAVATVVHVAPDAEERLEDARAALAQAAGDCGASAWSGMIVVRFAAPSPATVRHDVAQFLQAFRAGPLPRVWQC